MARKTVKTINSEAYYVVDDNSNDIVEVYPTVATAIQGLKDRAKDEGYDAEDVEQFFYIIRGVKLTVSATEELRIEINEKGGF